MLDVAIATHTPAGIERVAAQNLAGADIPRNLSARIDIEIQYMS